MNGQQNKKRKVDSSVARSFDSVCRGKFDNFFVDGLPAPPYKWKDGFDLEGPRLDPDLHLQIEPPTHVKTLDFRDVEFPYTPDQKDVVAHMAYTRPFRILSDEGVRVARAAVDANMDRLAHKDDRSACFLRGLGFVSNFHRDLSYNRELTDLLSSLARDPLGCHSMPLNISHTNIGQIKAGKPVDKWHVDSTDYVLVIVLSDQTDMVGGELRVLQMPDASNSGSNVTVFQRLQAEGVPEELVETVNYVKAGYGIFMQGSKILHSVSEVLQGREPRISCVNSYSSRRVFVQPDKTRYTLFASDDGEDVAAHDFARHKAWRVGGQLQYLRDQTSYDQNKVSTDELKEILRNAAAELDYAADLIEGKADDHTRWVEDKEK